MKKYETLSMKSIAYWSGCGGLEIKCFEGEKVYFVTGSWVGNPVPHSAKIYEDSKDGQYFRYNGHKIALSDCVRM